MSAVALTTEEQFALERRSYIGGSDMAAIYGVSPYTTAVELWLEKTGRRRPRRRSKAEQRILDAGKRLEPIIVDMTIEKLRDEGHDVELIARNKRYFDAEYPFLSCEIDFELMLDGEHINGDAKTVRGFAKTQWGDEETDEMPLHYHVQFMHGLGITGKRRCIVSPMMSLDAVGTYWAERDDEVIAAMRAKAVEFWNDCILGDKVPDIMRFDDVKAIYPIDNGKSIEADEPTAIKVERLRSIKEQIKSWENEAESLQLDIAEFISPHSILTIGGEPVLTWKAQEARRLDQEALEREHPDLFAKFKTTSYQRVMRFKKRKHS